MKRGILGFSLLVFLIQAVSAQFFGGYGGFSISNFFSSIDSETMTLGLLFLIFFTLIFYTLSRIFKGPYGEPNKAVAGTIALAVSLFIIYGIYQSGFYVGDLFYNIGISTEILYFIIPIIFLVLAFFLIKKIKLRGFLIVFGLFLILLTVFTEIFYEKETALVIGIVLVLVGLVLWWWKRRKGKRKLTGYYGDYGPSPRGPGVFGRWKEKRRELSDIKHQERLAYLKQKAGQKYERKLQKGFPKTERQDYKEIQRERRRRSRARDEAREERRRRAREEKVKKRYIRRFGKRAWKKREKEGRNF